MSSTASSTTTLDGNETNTGVKSATLPPSSRLNSVTKGMSPPPSPSPPLSTKVDVEPLLSRKGRFAASAYKLIRQTKRTVGRNLNRFGNSFKFKKGSENTVTSKEEEKGEVKNAKFKKLVRKNAIKRVNVCVFQNSNENINKIQDVNIKCHSSEPNPKTSNIKNVNRSKSNANKLALNLLNRKVKHDKNGTRNIKKEIVLSDQNENVQLEESMLVEETMSKNSNPVKFDEFFRCIEFENVNRGVLKSSSFNSKPIANEILPQKSHSFRVLSDNNNLVQSGKSLNSFEEFRLKLENFESSNLSNLNELKLCNNVKNRSTGFPIKCNLLVPPPSNLLVNRQESLESWNRFLHQLDDILMSRDGEFV